MIKEFSSVGRHGLSPMYTFPNWHLIFVSNLDNKWEDPNADNISTNSSVVLHLKVLILICFSWCI